MIVDILLEQNGTETRIESTNTLLARDLAEPTNQAVGEGGLTDQSNTGGLEGAEGDVGEEFGAGRGGEVDGSAVVGSVLVAEERDGLLLEELISAELEGALKEVAGERWANTGKEGASTLVGDDLAEAADHTAVVGGGVELDARLHAVGDAVSVESLGGLGEEGVHIDRSEGAMRNGAADCAGEGEARVEVDAAELLRCRRCGLLLDGVQLGAARRRGRLLGCRAHLACAITALLLSWSRRRWW